MPATRPHTSWKPLRTKRYDPDLKTWVSAIYGYLADCADCTWRGPARSSAKEARVDARFHECGE